MKTRLNLEAVAYSAEQYAPALCLWREVGETDCIQYGVIDYARVGYMDDAGQPIGRINQSRVYHSSLGAYVRYNNRRYYLNTFLPF